VDSVSRPLFASWFWWVQNFLSRQLDSPINIPALRPPCTLQPWEPHKDVTEQTVRHLLEPQR
jgi:hypothetical protein